ncbi:hypothetical protein COL516b_007827 [Colletotrichum fioriniae]|nr:uncharacterized protein COL516b_007827 [Colletotrichum fioriniae]KAJ0301424.1 hypothetical protein COL516b_007827 [Colletotrichum fioriniae]
MSSPSDQPPPESTPIEKHPGSTLDIAPRVAVQIKEEWTGFNASIRIIKDYGPGDPEFDNMTPKGSTKTSTNAPQAEKESFKAGDMAVCDHFVIDVPDIIMVKKIHFRTGKHSGYTASSVKQAIPREFVEYGLQMAGPVTIKD